MKIVGNDRNSDCLSINILSLLWKVYIKKNINNKTNKQTKQKRKKKKREREKKRKGTEQDSKPGNLSKIIRGQS